jgi:hypothetical protein
MAALKSALFAAPLFMPGNGVGMIISDYLAVAANFTVNDTIDFKIPAGMELTTIELDSTRMDTNGAPTLAYQAGYAPIQAESQYVAALTYFAPASGITIGRVANGNRVSLNFKPIKFDEDMLLRLTVNAVAATFAAGELRAILHGSARGVR